MSSYMSFYIRKDNNFLPITSYCRSSELYQIAQDYIPYGKVVALNDERICTIIGEINRMIEQWERFIDFSEKKIKDIKDLSDVNADERMELISQERVEIEGHNEDIENFKRVKYFFEFLMEIIDEVRWSDDFNENEYIYAGIDADPNEILEDEEGDM